jgi:hypothetical protein
MSPRLAFQSSTWGSATGAGLGLLLLLLLLLLLPGAVGHGAGRGLLLTVHDRQRPQKG